MTQAPKDLRVRALLLAALLVVLAACAGNPPDAGPFQVRTDRSAVSVPVRGQAVFGVLVTGAAHQSVVLAMSGSPAGTHVTINPNPVRSESPAVVLVRTSAATPVGTYPLTVKATRGNQTRTTIVRLVVRRFVTFALRMTPASAIVDVGGTATYQVAVERGAFAGPIRLRLSGLPAHVTATIAPSLSIRGRTAVVTVRVGTGAAPGSYLLTITGRGLLTTTSASVYLVIRASGPADFPISGTADLPMSPGGPSAAINLALTNPGSTPMSVSGLAVTVTGTNNPECGTANYAVIAYSGPGSLVVPANSTSTLQELGVVRAQWPQLRMVNLATNQDACKGAVVNLHYAGTGAGS